MKLKTPPPEPILSALTAAQVAVDRIAISIETDINLLGRYAPQWVIATREQVSVFDLAAPEKPALSLAFEQIEDLRITGGVGSGLLQAKVEGVWLDLVRYSNRLKYIFGRVATRLDQLRQGESFTLGDEDEHDPRRCRSCGLMLEFAGETCPRCINRGAAMSRLLQLMMPYRGYAALMMLLLLTAIALDMAGPLLTRFLVDDVLRVDSQRQPHWIVQKLDFTPAQFLIMIVGLLALVQVVRAMLSVFNGRLASRVGTAITFDIRGRLVDHLTKLSLSYYDKQQTGSLVGRVAYDTEAVQGFMGQLTAGFLMQILMVVFSAIMMFSIEPTLAIWTLLPAPFVFAGTFVMYRYVYPHYRRFWDRSSKQAGMLNSILSGVRVVKAFAQEDHELERYQKSSASLRDARRTVDTTAATFYPFMGLVFQVGGWLIWYIGGGKVLDGLVNPAQPFTLGDLMAFFGYLGMFYTPLNGLTQLTSWVTQFTTQVHRIFEVLDTPVAVRDTDKPVSLPQVKGDITFENVTFGYSPQTPILKKMNFTITTGESVGVVGRSGSGKTTLINLISRFYDVDEGTVLIDGHDIRKISTHDLRSQVGVVLQEPFLFRGTIWDNLIYGRRESTIEQVIAASRAGNCHDFVMKQIHGYDTWVGERGAGLSGGERQRLSIARVLLCEPRILILDEATSSVDSESELSIQQALAELIKGRTSIIIAHRLSTLRNCDKIIVVDDGKVVECGPHDELMKLNGRYAKLVRIQNSLSDTGSVDHLAEQAKQQERTTALNAAPPIDPTTGLPPITSHRPRWLTPEVARIHIGGHGSLHLTVMNERIYHGVYALRCLPVRYPSQYISLRYVGLENRVQEIGLIRDLKDWPAEAQQLVRESLLRRYFVHTIQSIEKIRPFHNFLEMSVTTDLGMMEFIMRYTSEAAQDYGRVGKILLDVEENRYLIPDLTQLAADERQMFERYIYW